MDDPGDRVTVHDRRLDLLDLLRARRLAEQQRLRLGGEDQGDEDEQDADAQGADAVPDAVAGRQRDADAGEGEGEADQGAEVLQQDDGEFGGLGAADELLPGELARG